LRHLFHQIHGAILCHFAICKRRKSAQMEANLALN